MQRFSAVFLFFALLFAIPYVTGNAAAADPSPCYRQFEFAERLFNEKDFERAITEYKRFIFLYPDDTLSEEAALMIGRSYFNDERWNESIVSFGLFTEKYKESHRIAEAHYFKGAGERRLKRFEDALLTLNKIIQAGPGEFYDKAVFESALVLLDKNDWGGARDLFSNIPDGSDLADSAFIYATGLDHMKDIPRKSPVFAGTVAAILPGAGHVYTERYRDALVAFLLNGAFIGAAYEFFDDEKYAAGSIFAFFELGWYGGNIYSAVSSAHKFNRRQRDDFIEGLKIRTGISMTNNYLLLSFVY